MTRGDDAPGRALPSPGWASRLVVGHHVAALPPIAGSTPISTLTNANQSN
jgi:hypothetical protein